MNKRKANLHNNCIKRARSQLTNETDKNVDTSGLLGAYHCETVLDSQVKLKVKASKDIVKLTPICYVFYCLIMFYYNEFCP